ncbi:pyridoxal phosphate-dependent aminotransferase [Ancylomarina euxinus]|uniref:Aminotransferase n=1 Tax=Ancylomarina euxinus TaxID=2283627 RepID=A0A425XXJ7_9BACT|nr:pyridoxal phosphate-dependent aminotransferase [Ancylomarina euxinus]MCZ4694711.1 pyridoxal phosphate-dependent aminotransferase [Ancylomarina euxinus]MUP16375.1 aminotransferase class I/II-fold pyridoxal phosphate-dependent enzyme [Ancylomarina euxinus]RRG19406.1 pyridoxal phosphate-dependent aminotransferase [Ancylomarina euxinus]
MLKVSNRITSMELSPTLAMSQKSRDMKEQGIDVINLSVGEPDFKTPDHIKEAAHNAIINNYSYYSPIPGFLKLREAICTKLKRDNDLDFTPEQVVVSNGAKQSILNVMMSVINPGDEVIIPSPYWVSYVEIVKLAQGINIFIPAGIEQNFKITPEQLEAAITPRTRAFLFSSPSNPTGSIYSRKELKALAQVFEKYPDIVIISDEIYEHINYIDGHESIAQFDELKDRTVIINGVSKGYAMTGWRIGYIAAPIWIAQACTKLQGQMTSGASTIAQMASAEALKGDQSCTLEMKKAFKQRREVAFELLTKIPSFEIKKPDGAFYFFPDVSKLFGKSCNGIIINNPTDLSLYLLNEAKVATVTGEAFGAPDCLRLSYATSEEIMAEAISRIKSAIDKLN